MAFHIYVKRKSDGVCVYDNPLGAGGTVYKKWHVPAYKLGLRLVGAIYDHHNGLRVQGSELDQLSHELDKLEKFWDQIFIRSGPLKYSTVDISTVWLREESNVRVGYLREAIRRAKECDGIVEIF